TIPSAPKPASLQRNLPLDVENPPGRTGTSRTGLGGVLLPGVRLPRGRPRRDPAAAEPRAGRDFPAPARQEQPGGSGPHEPEAPGFPRCEYGIAPGAVHLRVARALGGWGRMPR